MKRRYELRDDQWERIKDLLPPERKPQGGRPAIDNRKMVNLGGPLRSVMAGCA
jgi:transposase